MKLAAALLVSICSVGITARAADGEAEGRRHARRANYLAGENRCKAAIPEYDKALRMLEDPALLFNRADCFRRLGQADRALADYRQFLADLPAAPNRAQVEVRIAALEAESAAAARTAAGAPVAPRSGAAGAAAAAPGHSDDPAGTSGGVAADDVGAAPTRKAPSLPPRRGDDLEPPAVLLSSAATAPPAQVDDGSPSRWWIWAAVGAVVLAGGALVGYLVLHPSETEAPGSNLGTFKF